MPIVTESAMHEKQEWDLQWQRLDRESKFLGRFLRFCRVTMVAKEVASQIEKHFPEQGTFVEGGCGTSEDSCMVQPKKRTLIGMDFSQQALGIARKTGGLNEFLCGDLSRIPLGKNSIDGIWNVGVMEHFPAPALRNILTECSRVIKPGGKCIFLWPWALGPSTIILWGINWLRRKILGKQEDLYITEHSRVWSARHAMSLVKPFFGKCRVRYSWGTGLVFLIVIAEKS